MCVEQSKIVTAWIVPLGLLLAFGWSADPARAQLGLAGFSFFDGPEDSLTGSAIAAGDFNGDGFDDLAVGMPGANIGELTLAGAVSVFYGGQGAWASVDLVVAETLGGVNEGGSLFGSALAVGDFDNDGYDDLAIGVPTKTVNGMFSAGEVVVVYGSPQNLDLESAQFFSQDPLPGAPESGDQFGSSLAAGDLSADGIDDLAIGVHLEDFPGAIGVMANVGAVNIVYGSLGGGLTTDGSQLIHQDSPGVTFNGNTGERFGFSLVIGQFIGDPTADLAVGVPGEIVLGPGGEGAVMIFPGAVGGLDTLAGTERALSQETPGVLGTAQDNDKFGWALAAGDFNGDLFTDLAVGVPGESELGTTESGAVQVFFGAAAGLTEIDDQFFVESSFDTDVDPFDRLGDALAAGDFNADGRDDLAIGASQDNSLGFSDAGEIDVLYGTPNGLAIAGGQVFNMIFFDTLESEDRFGAALATGRFFSNSYNSQDLAVGVPQRGDLSLPGGASGIPSDVYPGAFVAIRSRSIFTGDFESGDVDEWSNSTP